MEPTKYSSKAVDTIVYALVSINLLISCVTYLNLTSQIDATNKTIASVNEASIAEIARLTAQSAEKSQQIRELSSQTIDLTIDNATLRGKMDRIEAAYPLDTVYDLARIACQDYDDVSPALVLAVAYEESRFDPTAENDGAIGLMQIDPRWHAARAERLGVVDYSDPYGSVLLGADYLHEIHQDLIAQTGVDDWHYVLMVYNMGYNTATPLYEQGTISSYATSIVERCTEYEHLFELLGTL